VTGAGDTTAAAAPAPPRRWRVPAPVDAGTPERRPSDLAMCVVAVAGVVLTGLWAQTTSDIDTNLFSVVNSLPNAFEGLAQVLTFLGSLWFVGIVVVALLLLRWFPAARDVAVAAGGAWLVARGLDALLGTRTADAIGVVVRTGDGPAFPVASVAAFTALTVALAPYLTRPIRRLLVLLIPLVALAAMYLGTGFASDVLGGLWLGLATGALVHVAFGAPGGRPSAAEIRDALTELGIDTVSVAPSATAVAHVTVLDAELASGTRARVVAYGRDQRDGQLAARLWHAVMYRAPGVPVFGSRLQLVEHGGYALLRAERAGLRVPRLVGTGIAGPDAAVLVTDVPDGRPLAELGGDLDDRVLAAAWSALDGLHRAGIAHGDLTPATLLLQDDGGIAFADLGDAHVGTLPYWHDRDVAALLVGTATAVGNDRAIGAAIAALGPDRVSAAIPLIQPAALPRGLGAGVAHLGKVLKELRTAVAAATGAEDVAPLKVKRLSLVNIGMLAGILLALAIAIPSLEGIDWHSVQQEFEHATWGWAVLTLILWPLIPMAWATALMGCVTVDLPFVPTVLTQVACSFLNLITPNGIGGTALQLDYLHHQDVPVASGASAMVLSTGVGGAIQMALFLIAAAITATTVESSNSGVSISLGTIAVVAALVGVILWIPKVRSKVVPAVKRAASDIWAVLRNPKKGVQLFGGDLAGNLIYPALLGLCLLAFGDSLSFAQLVVVQVGAGMLGNVAPVPGGIGVQEAALTAGLTSFGIDANTALATVLVFRAITFAIPPVIGFFTLHWLRRQGYA
jgi:uncharacterized membrane protein YbhN (UPF0104 family)